LPLERAIQVLTEFGLTNVQARVYIAAVQLRVASASQLSKLSKVRKEDVYRSLPNLESLGLVEKILSAPLKIRATPGDQALSILIKQEQKKTKDKLKALKTKKSEIIQNIKLATEMPILQEDQANFSLLCNRTLIWGKVSNIITNTRKELDLVYDKKKLAKAIFDLAKELKQAIQNGARLRIISDLQEYTESFQKTLAKQLSPDTSIEIRYIDSPINHFLISDFKEAMLATNTEGDLAEHPNLWTNNTSLIEILHRNFENLWHTAIEAKNIMVNASSSKAFELSNKVKPTNHAIFVYKSLEEKHRTLFNYLNAGLTNNEAVIYVASEETTMEIRAAMKKHGIDDVEKHEKTGALQILNYDKVYIINGKFNIETTINFFQKECYRALEKFSGFSAIGEMSCFFKNKMVADLLNYEKEISERPMHCGRAICAYNTKDLEKTTHAINIYIELLQAHGKAFLTGTNHTLNNFDVRTS